MNRKEKALTKFFDEIEIGETRPPSRRRTLTERDIENYCDLSGDWVGTWAAMFSDEAHFEATRFTEDRKTAPANLVLSQQYGLSPTSETLSGIVALYEFEEINYLQPLRVGDTFYYETEVIDKQPRGPEYGVVRTRRVVKNQRGEVVLTMVARARFRTRAAWEAMHEKGAEPLRERREGA
ncbi:MAG: hypothetical protein HY690_15800 [Chloroflexi bacterium]|nr:hypothetical protein [Chloroflexota bacterium]